MKRSILVILGAEPGASGSTPAIVRSACAALCGDLGIGVDFREAEDQDALSRSLLADGPRSAGIIFNAAGLPETPASDEMRRAALLKLARLRKPVIEVCAENVYRLQNSSAQPLPEAAVGAGFICGFGTRGFLLAIRSIVNRLGATPDAAMT